MIAEFSNNFSANGLGSVALPVNYRHIALEDVASTNTNCLELAKRGEGGGLWITAERQLSGKGSRGRKWVSERGNLYASLLLDMPSGFTKLHTLTFVACLAIRDAIYRLEGAQYAAVTLKWPNDVLLNGKKTSGILLESHQIGDRRIVIIGMGINIAHFPTETKHPATCLNDHNIGSPVGVVFSNLADAIDRRLTQWDGGRNFEQIRSDWLQACEGLGKPMRVELPAGNQASHSSQSNAVKVFSGSFEGIDEDGLLLLAGTEGSIKKISVADVFF